MRERIKARIAEVAIAIVEGDRDKAYRGLELAKQVQHGLYLDEWAAFYVASGLCSEEFSGIPCADGFYAQALRFYAQVKHPGAKLAARHLARVQRQQAGGGV